MNKNRASAIIPYQNRLILIQRIKGNKKIEKNTILFQKVGKKKEKA